MKKNGVDRQLLLLIGRWQGAGASDYCRAIVMIRWGANKQIPF